MSCCLSRFFFLGLGLLFTVQSFAQSSLVSSGSTINGNTAEVSFSLGQFAYREIEGNSTFIHPGVQQPFQVIPLGAPSISNLQVWIFPNPSLGELYIEFDELAQPALATLFNAQGKFISDYILASKITSIPTSNLSGGVYFLSVTMNSKTQQTFKIIVKS